MSPVAAPSDRRFRRSHVKPSRRRHDWHRVVLPIVRYIVTAALLVYGMYAGAGVIAHAHVLQVDRIVVHGNERLTKDDVLAALKGLRGENLVWTDLDGWRRHLLATPWVAAASLRRSLPSTVDVVIAERQPMAIARLNGDMYLVDDHGVVIDQYGPHYADLDLPIIDGLGAAPSESGLMADQERAEAAGRVIAALAAKPAIAKRLSQIDVTNLHNIAVILNGDSAVIRLGEDQFLTRVQMYLDLASALRERVPEIDYVDLRFDDRIYVRPIGKTPRMAAGASSKAGVHQAPPKKTKKK
jgi:cell division protein FtsQ